MSYLGVAYQWRKVVISGLFLYVHPSMLHNGVFTLDERLQHEKLGRKRDFCGAEIFNNGLFRPAKKIYYGYLW